MDLVKHPCSSWRWLFSIRGVIGPFNHRVISPINHRCVLCYTLQTCLHVPRTVMSLLDGVLVSVMLNKVEIPFLPSTLGVNSNGSRLTSNRTQLVINDLGERKDADD